MRPSKQTGPTGYLPLRVGSGTVRHRPLSGLAPAARAGRPSPLAPAGPGLVPPSGGGVRFGRYRRLMSAAVGYSGKPLAAKLGVRDGSRVLLVGAPDGFGLAAPAGAVVRSRPGGDPYDVVLAFCPDRAALRRRFAPQLPRLTTAGALWIAWPKRSSGVATDLDENVVRAHGLAVGLVDVKVAAVDATWSGLKFVRRLADR